MAKRQARHSSEASPEQGKALLPLPAGGAAFARPPAGKGLLFAAILAALLLAFVEASACVTARLISARGWMACVPRFEREKELAALRASNPLTGWGDTPVVAGRATRLLANPNPSLSDPARARISFYGDSYTRGGPPEISYPYFVSRLLRVPVANYGVGGFGSDQALMLFESQVELNPAPVVVLGHLTENLLRNINQFRNLLYPGGYSEYAFKPRFILERGELVYIPSPVRAIEDFRRLSADPASVLEHDAFLHRARSEFPYSLNLARWLFTDYMTRTRFKGVPNHHEYYDPRHPTQGLQLTTAILRRFAKTARGHGKKPYLLSIPTCHDLKLGRNKGIWSDQPLIDALRSERLPIIHAGPLMLPRISGSPVDSLFDFCNGHPNEKGYRILAEVVSEAVGKAVAADPAATAEGAPDSRNEAGKQP